ncbi:unnamed protein product [Owenia fusiformis]|uniref:Uncharacterized protein n=1 Tax=Owenia fusiformis TaxID=6347 RepID=A0A8J1UEH7_OWEFU|nr:unnamed protein product [Owenia fusiformis]
MATGYTEEAPLTSAHISALKACKSIMTDTLDMQQLMDMCSQENIITNSMKDKILARSSARKQCKEFIDCFETQSVNTFNAFVNLLREDYGFLVKKIEKELWGNILDQTKYYMQLANNIDGNRAYEISQTDGETLREILRNVEALLQKCPTDEPNETQTSTAKQKELEAQECSSINTSPYSPSQGSQGYSSPHKLPPNAPTSAPQAYSSPYQPPPGTTPSAYQSYSSPYQMPPSAPPSAPQAYSSPYQPPPNVLPSASQAYSSPSQPPPYSPPNSSQAYSSPYHVPPNAAASIELPPGYNSVVAARSDPKETNPTVAKQKITYKNAVQFPEGDAKLLAKIKLIKEKTLQNVKTIHKIEFLKNDDILLEVKKQSKMITSKEIALLCDPNWKTKKTLVEKDVLSVAAKDDLIAVACGEKNNVTVKLFQINGEHTKDIRIPGSPKSMTFTNPNEILFNSEPGKLCYLDIQTGEIVNKRFYESVEEVQSIAVAPNNNIVVAHEQNVTCIDKQGEEVFCYKGGDMEMISSVCVDSLGHIFIAGTNIYVLTQNGISLKERSLPGLQTPNAVAVNNQGELVSGTQVLFGSAEVFTYKYREE